MRIHTFTAEVFYQNKYQDFLNENYKDLIKNKVREIVGSGLESGEKFEIVQSDCPWDSSGELEKIGDHLRIEEYEYVTDFLEELTGERIPTFESGCGWHFETYQDLLNSVMDELNLEKREIFLGGLKKDDVQLIKSDLSWPLDREGKFEVFEALEFWLIEAELCSKIEEWLSGIKTTDLLKK
jgi:hypothetical protein